MRNYRLLLPAAVAGFALAASAPAASAQEPPVVVSNYGQCVSEGFPAPSGGLFGPLVSVYKGPDLVAENVPPGQEDAPFGSIGCPVVVGPDEF